MNLTTAGAIDAIIHAAMPAPVIFAAGHPSRIAYGMADRPNHLYLTGPAGSCVPLATGVVLATRRVVVAVDDASPAALVAAGLLLPLVHVFLDTSTGAARMDTKGYRAACVVATEQSLAAAIRSAVALAEGPTFIRCPVERPAEASPGPDLPSRACRFAAYVTGGTRAPRREEE
jgi:hypothetical protein